MAVLTPLGPSCASSNAFPIRRRASTVDRFQGKDAACVVVSFARADASSGLLADPRRLNVALPRAPRMLILVGRRRASFGVAALRAAGGGGAGRRGVLVSLQELRSSVIDHSYRSIARNPFCQPLRLAGWTPKNRRWQSWEQCTGQHTSPLRF